MKILYGINGVGNGHLTRSRIMAKELSKKGFDVTYLFSGRDESKYFDMEPFGSQVIFKKGLCFSINDGKVNVLKTILNNDITRLLKDIDHLDLSTFDLVISDYEPITAWASKLQKVKSLGIGHQFAFKFDIPKSGFNLISKLVMQLYAPVSMGIGLHWDSFGFPIFPPIIDPLSTTNNKDIIVYLPFESNTRVVELLSPLSEYQFHIFGSVPVIQAPDHIHFNEVSKQAFIEKLCSCEGVICNAGFELASEAIHLNKKLLVKPVHGQPEQDSNALAISILGYGHEVPELSTSNIDLWLHSKSIKHLPSFPNVAELLVEWISNGMKESLEHLSIEAWNKPL